MAASIDKREVENISVRELNVVHQSCNNAFLRSSIEVYEGILGSLEILLASYIAASVSLLNFGISTLKGRPPCGALIRIIAPDQIEALIQYIDLRMADSTISWHMDGDGT